MGDRKRKDNAMMTTETSRLMVDDFFDIKPLKIPQDAWKDHKKLTRFLTEIQGTINRLVKACQVQSRLTANELVARPTYAEEFQNIRDSVHKAVAPNYDGTFSDVGSQRSGYSHNSARQRAFTIKDASRPRLIDKSVPRILDNTIPEASIEDFNDTPDLHSPSSPRVGQKHSNITRRSKLNVVENSSVTNTPLEFVSNNSETDL